MNPSEIVRLSPKNIPDPVGKYSHITIVPKNSNLYVFSGQVGVDNQGYIPGDLCEQIKNTFLNLGHLLEDQSLTSDNIIKINIWATETIDWELLYTVWDKLFAESYPSMTVAYVKALGLSEIKIEIEMWAAK